MSNKDSVILWRKCDWYYGGDWVRSMEGGITWEVEVEVEVECWGEVRLGCVCMYASTRIWGVAWFVVVKRKQCI